MVILNKKVPSRKRPSSSFISPILPPKIPKDRNDIVNDDDAQEKMVSILADAGCTLMNPSGPPCLPTDQNKFRSQLTRVLSSSVKDKDNNATDKSRAGFVAGFSSYVQSAENLRRVLVSSNSDGVRGKVSGGRESLVRNLLLVPAIQLDIQILLLEKLPEYFDCGTILSLEDDVARLIINQFRWLDFVVDPDAFIDKLMEVLSICPLHLKKEIIGSLPEIIGDHNNKVVVNSMERMLQEESAITVPVLDSFSNLNLDAQLQEQVITIALSCIRTIDAEHMPYLLRFLMLSATPVNVRRIISQIREQLKFMGISKTSATQNKLKGKSPLDNTDASILDALRSSFRFKNILCQEILKELNSLEKPREHKAIDIWLLMLIYINGEPFRQGIEKIFKKKVIENRIQENLIDQCIFGNKELVQDYFPSFLSLAEYLMTCKERKARDFGSHVYICLFEEFVDTYSRQEILGALVTHVGSGINLEVSAALDTLTLLTTKHAHELIPFSSYLNGILDYLEGFSIENLHKVYEVFSHLTLSARTSQDCFKSSISNELMMIVRKQVSHPDMKYKKMGLIGTLKIVSCLGDVCNATCSLPSQESGCDEALELLKMSLDSCKQLCLPLILFYDELSSVLDHRTLHPKIMEWIGMHVGEFESIFLADLEGGELSNKESYCGLEGELWMNLDGDISPICLNILPLTCSSSQSFSSFSSLQTLPSNFLLLSTVERLTNQGSLAGIDALLGCPLHLPSSKYFTGAGWRSLTGKQKHIVSLSLYYAANWIRELLNAFSTQVAGRSGSISQATKEDTVTKLFKRLRNLVFLENLLTNMMKLYPLSLPEIHLYVEHSGSSLLDQNNYMRHAEKKNEKKKSFDGISQSKKKLKITKASNSDSSGKFRQPSILDALRKAGAVISQKEKNEDSSVSSSKRTTESLNQQPSESNEPLILEVPAGSDALEAQRFKLRPLLPQCFSLLIHLKNQDSDCSSSGAELPVYMYLLRDLRYKLDYLSPLEKQFPTKCLSVPVGFSKTTVDEFLNEVRPLFPSLKSLLDGALCILNESDQTCEESWKLQSAAAGNPDILNVVLSESSISTCIFKEVLYCFNKILNLSEVHMDETVQSNLLKAFQPIEMPDISTMGMEPPIPSVGTTEYLYLGACFFLEDVLSSACSFSFVLASESLLTLESVVKSVQKYFDKVNEINGKNVHTQQLLSSFCIRLGTSAQKLLKYDWNDETLENGWKNKGEIVQKILRTYLEASGDSTSDLLDELACSILPQVVWSKSSAEDDGHGFPSLCSATFVVWYRVLHETNLNILNKLVKGIVLLGKRQAGVKPETTETHLTNLLKTVNVLVSLVNVCKTHDKVTIHAMAVKYGGKFVDSFLKVFDFLQDNFQSHYELIIQLMKELQKGTRTIQTLCSEAKGLKQTIITSKVPATKRSLERFLFHVKALLHSTPSGCTFWMGNLKHKDLTGQVVSSQAYVDNQNNDFDEDSLEAVDENLSAVPASEDEGTE